MQRRLAFAGVAALFVATALAGCGTETPERAVVADVPAGERLVLRPSRIADVAEVGATITTRDMADVRARIPGLLTDLSVREGDRVRAGQRIATIIDSRLGQEAGAYGAQAAAAEAQAARARAELDRIGFLYREGVYAKARLDDATAQARAADAQVKAARAQQGAVNAVAGQGAVVAPAAGRVLRADIPAGSAVAPGMVIATITAGPPVVRLDVPEALGRSLVVGAPVTISGLAGRPADATISGRVAKIYPGITGGRLTADAAIGLVEPALVGQRVVARVDVGMRTALVVPSRFVAPRFGLHFATLLSADGKRASDVPVEIRPIAGTGTVEILSGLRAGDTIIARAAA